MKGVHSVRSIRLILVDEPLVVREEPEDTAESLHYKFQTMNMVEFSWARKNSAS